jgi:hypothetical protein
MGYSLKYFVGNTSEDNTKPKEDETSSDQTPTKPGGKTTK